MVSITAHWYCCLSSSPSSVLVLVRVCVLSGLVLFFCFFFISSLMFGDLSNNFPQGSIVSPANQKKKKRAKSQASVGTNFFMFSSIAAVPLPFLFALTQLLLAAFLFFFLLFIHHPFIFIDLPSVCMHSDDLQDWLSEPDEADVRQSARVCFRKRQMAARAFLCLSVHVNACLCRQVGMFDLLFSSIGSKLLCSHI